MNYYDFEIWIQPATPQASYPVYVTNSPSGTASNVMHFDIQDANVQALLTPIMSASENAPARETFGQLLFDSLFAGAIGVAWNKSVGRANHIANGIRLRLWIDAPELSVLPWELLNDKADFLAVSGSVVVSRFLPAGEPPAFVTPEKARVLIVIQEPPNLPVKPEVPDELEAALQNSSRFAAPKVLKNSTLAQINNELLSGYEVLHYIGHGAPDKLLLASDSEVSIKNGREFAALFTGQPTLQLVVLNVCASGATTSRGIFSGLGPFLAEKRLPAVVAMQYSSVYQTTAAEFNGSFYAALDKSVPVDVAVNTARRALILSHAAERDWSTPVLYMTTRSGSVLEFVNSPVQAALRTSQLIKEQSQREAANREMAVSLGEIADGLGVAKDVLEVLKAAKRLQARLNSYTQRVTVGDWKLVRQTELSDLEAKIKGITELEDTPWFQKLLAAAKALTSNLNNANFGAAKINLDDFEDALTDGTAELERIVEEHLREYQERAAATIARFRIE